jgi:hypothetical protein
MGAMTEPAAPGAAPSYRIQGRTVTLPVRVGRASVASAMFLVRTEAVRRLVTHPNLHVPEVVPGRTLATLAAIEYVENDLGNYDEIAVVFFAEHGTRRPGRWLSLPLGLLRGTAQAYIHRLPVNQGFTCEAGQSIWGFPKTVDEIAIDDSAAARRTCTWRVDGRLVWRLELPRGGRGRYADRTLHALSCRDGVLYRTPFVSHGSEVGGRPGGARLELGDHPIADELRSLGLPRRALVSSWVGHLSAEFGAAQKL